VPLHILTCLERSVLLSSL